MQVTANITGNHKLQQGKVNLFVASNSEKYEFQFQNKLLIFIPQIWYNTHPNESTEKNVKEQPKRTTK